jgi:uncharacterized caspase-like protein
LRFTVSFAGADARAFHDQIIKTAGALYTDTKTTLLTNDASADRQPTAANIVDAFDLLREPDENDMVVVFLSGHGVNDSGSQYLFLPTDARSTPEGGFRSSSVLSWAALEDGLRKARGRRLLFVDSCHAANSYNDDNIAVFSAVDRDNVAEERAELGHGVFTYAVLRGLKGEAARDREVRLLGLADFVDRVVPRADQRQPATRDQHSACEELRYRPRAIGPSIRESSPPSRARAGVAAD